MQTILYFIRHGQVDNPHNLVYGRSKIPLSEFGKQQAIKLSERLKENAVIPTVIYASPLQRTKETAEIMQQTFPQTPIIYDNDLEESYMDGLTNKTLDYLHSLGDYYHNDTYKTVEKPEAIEKRIHAVLKEILKKYQGKTILVISHGDPLAFLYWKLLHPDEPLQPINWLHTNEYLHRGQAWRIVLDEQEHLVASTLIS